MNPTIEPKVKGVFIKFGEKNHLLQLREEGYVYCSPLSRFIKTEAGPAFDKYETVIELHCFGEGTARVWPIDSTFEEKGIEFPCFDGELITEQKNLGNVFCLHFLDYYRLPNNDWHQVDPRNAREGNWFLVIERWKEFFSLLRKALEDGGYDYKIGMVKYSDFKQHHGPRTPFMKDLSYQHENEARVFIECNSKEAIGLRLGSLKHVSTLFQGSMDQVRFRSLPDGNTQIVNYAKMME